MGKYGDVIVIIGYGQGFLAIGPLRDFCTQEKSDVIRAIGERDFRDALAFRFGNVTGYRDVATRDGVQRGQVSPLHELSRELIIILRTAEIVIRCRSPVSVVSENAAIGCAHAAS